MSAPDSSAAAGAKAGGAKAEGANRGYSVWIEAEGWDEGSWDPADEATDVVVSFDGGARWIASFVAYGHVPTLAARNRESGECLGGRYLWASDLVLAERVDRPTIEAVVADLIRDGGFESAFTAYGEEAAE